ncbi:MAG: alpha/beta fold hydrolase, partial [Pseudomonadota bacterium]
MIGTSGNWLKKRPKTAAVVFLAVVALTANLFSNAADDGEWQAVVFRGVERESREIETHRGTRFTVIRGTIEVPEVRAKPESRSIEIGYAIVPGIEGAQGAPVVMLAGGPGGSHIRSIESAWVHARIELFRRISDVVMVDLRGIHSSRPAFDLDGPSDKFRVVRSREDSLAFWRDVGAAGRQKLVADGFDLSGYTVVEAAADVIAVADALGYETVNLYGTSFGSHFTLTTTRLFPERVERFFVTGVEGYDHTFDDGAEVLKAVREIAREAEGVWAGA